MIKQALHFLNRIHMKRTASVVHWFAVHAGRRGVFLLFLCVLDVIYAYSLSISPAPGQHVNPWWTWIWFAAAANALSGAFIRKDRIQYAIAAGVKVSWALYELQGFIEGSNPRGWISATVWFSFALIVLLIASWPEENGLAIEREQADRDNT
jgi:hypothetical protein